MQEYENFVTKLVTGINDERPNGPFSIPSKYNGSYQALLDAKPERVFAESSFSNSTDILDSIYSKVINNNLDLLSANPKYGLLFIDDANITINETFKVGDITPHSLLEIKQPLINLSKRGLKVGNINVVSLPMINCFEDMYQCEWYVSGLIDLSKHFDLTIDKTFIHSIETLQKFIDLDEHSEIQDLHRYSIDGWQNLNFI